MWEAKLASAETADVACLPPGAEVYVSYDGPLRAVVISHFVDEAAVLAYAGDGWHDDASPETAAFAGAVAGDPHVWHFTRLA